MNAPFFLKSASWVLLVAALSIGFATISHAQSSACEGPARSGLDFWEGEWRLLSEEGLEIGTSTVTKVLGGCALQEDFVADEVRGRGLTFLVPGSDTWEQHWVDSLGRVAHLRGQVGAGRASFEGEHIGADGEAQKARATLEKGNNGQVSYRLELSSDDGVSWDPAFTGAYLPMGESTEAFRSTRASAAAAPTKPTPAERVAASAEPASPQAKGPAASRRADPPPANKSVEPLTRAADLSELSGEYAAVQMASPMTLRLPLGALDKLPRGYAWSTEDTAVYSCQGTSIRRVRVTPERKGGKVRLKVDLALYSGRYSQAISVEAALVPADGQGSPYTSGVLKRARVGRANSAQASDGFTEKSVQMELNQATFERLFTSDQRPKLELTLSVL